MRRKQQVVALLSVLLLAGIVGATPDQPNMQSAKVNLQNARAQLQAASPNKGGHRAKAMGLINAAITEVNKGISFRRRNAHASFSPVSDQPHMEAALSYLRNAKSDLERATADKGGHRANAINLVNEAIDEVKKGIDAGE
jgi:hypothetical protein